MIEWPAVETFAPAGVLPAGLQFAQLARSDIPRVCAALRAWYPDISVGMESVYLHEQFFRDEVALAGEVMDRAVYVLLVTEANELVAVASVEYDERARVLHGRLFAIAPAHRSGGLGKTLARTLGEELGRCIGAELLLSYATLKHRYSQLLLEALGYSLVGVVPGHDRDEVTPGIVKRVHEALYMKLLVGDEAVLEPELGALLEHTASLLAYLSNGNP